MNTEPRCDCVLSIRAATECLSCKSRRLLFESQSESVSEDQRALVGSLPVNSQLPTKVPLEK